MDNLPLVEQLYAFFNQMEKETKKKGESVVLFENPDSTVMADPELLKALNNKLRENPDYPVPEGFRKINEKILSHDYRVPKFIEIKESQHMALDILSDLIFEKFQFHILEPIIKTEIVTKIRPIIKKEFTDKKRAVPRYLDSLEGRIKPNTLQNKIITPVNKTKYYTDRKFKLTENMRLEIVNQPMVKRAHMQECAEVLCEILDAAEKGLTNLPPRNKYGPGGLKNKAIMMREHLMQQELINEQNKYKKLQKISKKWKNEKTQREEERIKTLEETRAERIAQRKKERENYKKKYEALVKRNEDRVKEKQEKLLEIAEQIKEQEKEFRAKTKGKREKEKEEHEAFLEKEKERLQKEMSDLVKEREELKKIEEKYHKQEKEVKENVKGQVMEYFKKNKDKLKLDKKEKEEVKKFSEKAAVKEILHKYDIPLRYFFDFYSKSEHHEISFQLDSNMETMNYKEFIRFGYQSHIVPALLPVEEMTHTFRLLVRERQEELDNENMQVLDYKYFIKALIRIAAISQDYLGGQKGKKLEKRIEELEKEKQRTIKIKKKLAKKFAKKKYESDRDSLERGEISGNETDKTDKSRAELTRRGAKKPNKKIIYKGLKDQTLKNTTYLKNVVSEADILNRKSKNVNTLIQVGQKGEILQHLKHVKIEDKRVTRSVDVKLISEKTIESLLNYLQLLPEDNKYTLDKKLNKVVRYNTGVKPNKILKKMKPVKVDPVDRGSSSEEDETNNKSDGSPLTARSKTEKTSKTGQSESEDDGDTTNK